MRIVIDPSPASVHSARDTHKIITTIVSARKLTGGKRDSGSVESRIGR